MREELQSHNIVFPYFSYFWITFYRTFWCNARIMILDQFRNSFFVTPFINCCFKLITVAFFKANYKIKSWIAGSKSWRNMEFFLVRFLPYLNRKESAFGHISRSLRRKKKVFVSEHIVFLLKTLYLLSVKLNCQNEVKNRTEYRVEWHSLG